MVTHAIYLNSCKYLLASFPTHMTHNLCRSIETMRVINDITNLSYIERLCRHIFIYHIIQFYGNQNSNLNIHKSLQYKLIHK